MFTLINSKIQLKFHNSIDNSQQFKSLCLNEKKNRSIMCINYIDYKFIETRKINDVKILRCGINFVKTLYNSMFQRIHRLNGKSADFSKYA